ncbi:DUF1835 domain-containing protein [Bacillus benzoevorans]|uniref:DUF1835 domain-containing protein n=1 Tax=Bacillus benzoevorans TaxID=1456 RepID=A0A7X0HVX6_9BACI|nr:DUF1835 domain-containing protein [Bacillus benzoevorans]MBB6447874.1 hypothetical protein [Bacillus benzoevorans]
MIEKLYQSIEKLSGSEARNLLINMMIKIKNMRESKDLQEELLGELYSLYDEALGVSQSKMEIAFNTVHIACGESTAGTLRYGLGRGNKVIGIPEFFSIGSIWELHKDVGRKHRYEWLKDHINMEMDYLEEEYERKITKTLEEIDAIPGDVPIVIWTADNAEEQTGMRYFMYLLKEKPNDVLLINTSLAYQELFVVHDDQYFHHTGTIYPEQLKEMYKKNVAKLLSVEERDRYQREWILLTESKEVLRIWQNKQITFVNESHFDSFIITAIQKLHAEQGHKDFILAAKIIGEVLGLLKGSVFDAFLEYRIRELVYNGVFEIKGIPKDMRSYSVRVKNNVETLSE